LRDLLHFQQHLSLHFNIINNIYSQLGVIEDGGEPFSNLGVDKSFAQEALAAIYLLLTAGCLPIVFIYLLCLFWLWAFNFTIVKPLVLIILLGR
jgi:hypothetical protein